MCKRLYSLLVAFCFCLLSAAVFGEGTLSAKERQIALNLNQEILLLQLEESMKQNIEEREKIKKELNDSRESSKKSKQEIEGLRQSLKNKELEYQEKERLYNELLTSIDKSEKSRKSAETERDLWRGVAIGATLIAVGYVVGDKIDLW